MRKKFFIFFLFVLIGLYTLPVTVFATDLLEVYRQAEVFDPQFQQALARKLSTQEGLPISLSQILPNANLNINPSVTRTGFSGTSYVGGNINGATLSPRNTTVRAFGLILSVTQTVFDFGKFSAVQVQVADSKAAAATLNAALQDLMLRASKAYFTVLNDEENLNYARATKRAYYSQLQQVEELFKVGLKTKTDVATAESAYDTSVASVIASEATLANDRENLRAITGVYYPNLARLSDQFPLVHPTPSNVEIWIETALRQNWSIKNAQYNVDAARSSIRQQFAGHLPTVNAEGIMDRYYTNNVNNYTNFTRNGPGTQSDREVELNINVPLFSGGGVVAQTQKACYDYQASEAALTGTVSSVMNSARQSYNNITAEISQIKADKQAIKSAILSLEGIEASYHAGTETLVDVITQQQNVYKAQTQYATDRYAFVNNILLLKDAAGTLSFDDLVIINSWLIH